MNRQRPVGSGLGVRPLPCPATMPCMVRVVISTRECSGMKRNGLDMLRCRQADHGVAWFTPKILFLPRKDFGSPLAFVSSPKCFATRPQKPLAPLPRTAPRPHIVRALPQKPRPETSGTSPSALPRDLWRLARSGSPKTSGTPPGATPRPGAPRPRTSSAALRPRRRCDNVILRRLVSTKLTRRKAALYPARIRRSGARRTPYLGGLSMKSPILAKRLTFTKALVTLSAMVMASAAAAAPQPLINYFLPMPVPTAGLSKTVWGAAVVGPRDPANGLEDNGANGGVSAGSETNFYWDGKILKGSDGKYHLYCVHWKYSIGFGPPGWGGAQRGGRRDRGEAGARHPGGEVGGERHPGEHAVPAPPADPRPRSATGVRRGGGPARTGRARRPRAGSARTRRRRLEPPRRQSAVPRTTLRRRRARGHRPSAGRRAGAGAAERGARRAILTRAPGGTERHCSVTIMPSSPPTPSMTGGTPPCPGTRRCCSTSSAP